MKTVGRLKVISAVVLAASLALPISSCTRYVSPDGQAVGLFGLGPPRPDSRAVSTYDYVLSSFSPRHPGNWALLFSYLWPLLVVAYRPRVDRPVLNRLLWWLQAPLLVGSVALIGFAASWGSPALGAYVSGIALCGYAVTWLLTGVLDWRSRHGGREPNHRMQATAGGLGGGITRDGRAPAAPDAQRYATFSLRRPGLTVSWTRAPKRVSMSIRASVLNKSMRPRRRSLTLGCETRRTLAAGFCLSPRDAMIFWTSIMRSARTRRCSASSRRNPRSRNTLPVEGVILSFLDTLPSRQPAYATLGDQGPVPLLGQRQIGARRLPRTLLERVEHIDGLRELSEVQHPMLKGRVNSDLAHARSDGRHGLPLQGFQALLNASKLNARQTPGIPRKRTHVPTRGTEPLKPLIGHELIYEYLYEQSSQVGPVA